MSFLRFFFPRRKENVLRFLAFSALCTFILFLYSQFRETNQEVEVVSKDRVRRDVPMEHQIPDYSKPRRGPGENGAAVVLSGEEKRLGDESMKKWFMNVVASDKISLDRSIPDTRHPECKRVKYDENLPTASVVIIFHEEAWTPLIRTVHSVINRSPPHLLHEVVLLDDASSREELKDKLTEYVKRFGSKVNLVRVKERQGLVRARLEGAKAATGDVLVFLDSHCEANVGWLEPLLQRIKEKRSAVLCPIIDIISDHALNYWGAPASSVGGFWWSLHFKWIGIQKSENRNRKSAVAPLRLEPILQRIKQKRSAVLCPMIDAINDASMAYPDYSGSISIGGFTWSLFFTWFNRDEDEKRPKSEPVK